MMRSGPSRSRTSRVARGANIMRFVVGAQLTMAGWRETITHRMPHLRDDRGAVTVETVIIAAVLGGAALALATYLAVDVIPGWQEDIPTEGGG